VGSVKGLISIDLTFMIIISHDQYVKSIYRGILAVIGVLAGFFTLVFLSQTYRYLQLALIGDELSLGMFGVYVLLSFAGGTATVVCFRPKSTTAKYLSGMGIGAGGMLFLVSLYLFTSDISSGLMLLIFAVVQIAIAAMVYGGARILSSDSDEQSSTPSEHTPETTMTESASKQSNSSAELGLGEIDWGLWFRGAQTLIGVSLFAAGIPITIDSPVGVPVLVVGLTLIPAVRRWGRGKLSRAKSAQS